MLAGGTPAYEVIHIQVYPAGEMWGKFYPEREVYPNDEQWGKRGWTYSHRDKAEEAFTRLVVSLRAARGAEDLGDDRDESTAESRDESLSHLTRRDSG